MIREGYRDLPHRFRNNAKEFSGHRDALRHYPFFPLNAYAYNFWTDTQCVI